ncbi:hypothetical protein ASE73_00060 [Sphingomonas sp. Leaf24]|uniref:hypothetical protein n=1 Tax=unclassified Sphingomonas TaxID=196159 RepID=UPI0006F54482|nr:MULTISPECIES: hypothetical protein [unclassified Sphingomonas]KQM22690.1 hypothetical protein ASE50_00060 [Sphingomonas sp. Leaf5]KQM95546.1 hypothetical protein ASE73_00060 [Sphingomonas sp. Leaf24]
MWNQCNRSLLALQGFAVAAAFAMFGLWPPASGAMVLVSLDGSSRNELAKIALAGGAALLRAGNVPGSMVVSGNRADITMQLHGRAILIIAASGLTCGSGSRGK